MDGMTRVGKWAVRLGWAMVVPVVVLGIAVLGLRLFFIPMSVQSGSMVPVLQVGDLILVKKVDPVADLEVGDIITYERASDGQTIVHRIIEDTLSESGGEIITKGDANQREDTPITADQVTGRVEHTIPKAGVLWVRTPGRVPPAVIGGAAYLVVLTGLIMFGDRAERSAERKSKPYPWSPEALAEKAEADAESVATGAIPVVDPAAQPEDPTRRSTIMNTKAPVDFSASAMPGATAGGGLADTPSRDSAGDAGRHRPGPQHAKRGRLF